MQYKLRKIIIRICIVLMLCGCARIPKYIKPLLSREAKVWLEQMAAIEVEEVFLKNHQLYFKYNTFLKDSDQQKTFYATASWDSLKYLDIELDRNLVVNLEFIDVEKWKNKPNGMISVKSIASEHWNEIRLLFAAKIAPEEKNMGNVIRSDEKELLFYYDQEAELKVVGVEEKPVNIRIKNTYSQSQFSEIIISSLEKYLADNEIDAGKILLVTKNGDNFASPFLFVDIDENIAVSLKIKEDVSVYQQNIFKKGIKTADQIILDSHVFGVVVRPFSSAFRIFSWSKGAAYDVINPNIFSKFINKQIPPISDGPSMDIKSFEEKLDKVVGHDSSFGSMDFLIGGDQYFPRLIEALIDAKESILLRTFIFDNDDYAVKIADILKRKSKEKGIKIKVLLDGMGQIMGEGKMPDDLPAGFKPPYSMVSYLMKDSKIEVRVRPNAWFKADHTKTITIDNKVCFTGGMNIGREYRYHWHDLMVELTGPILDEIIYEFNVAWAHSGKFGDLGLIREVFLSKKRKKNVQDKGGHFSIRPLYTRVNDPQIYRAQIAAIKAAKKYIYINNAYFSDNTILYELIKARRRGVDVRIILPIGGNHKIMNASNVVTANIMFKNGISVYFYPGMSHIKAAIYDGWLCTGSANFDKLSLRDNLEFNLATSHANTVLRFKEMLFEIDLKKSKIMDKPLKSGLRDFVSELIAEQL